MPTIVQFRRGTTAENDNFTGANGEISIDTTLDVIRVHDGSTVGGFALVGQNAVQTISNKTFSNTTFSGTVVGNLIPSANVTYNLGNATNRWNDLYLANTTIYLGNAQISANATSLIFTNPQGAQTVLSGTSSDISANTVTATGNVSASYFIGNGSQLTGIDATAIQNGSANVRTFLNGNVTVSASGQANVLVVTSTGANIAGTLNATGNANVGNIGATNVVATNLTGTLQTASQTNITSVGTLESLTVTGNVSTGNVSGTLGSFTTVTATGNITGGNLTINTDAVITGNLTVNGTTTTINSNTITTNDLNITVGNNQNTGTALNNAGLDVGNNNLATWRFNNATTSWQSNIAIMPTANGTLTLGGTSNYWGATYVTSLTASGNANVGNIGATNANITAMTASGNISAAYFLGNGSQLTGIDATAIQNGTANVRTFLNGNVTTSAAGVANVLVVTSTGANVAGTFNATGNANVGNIGATNANITAMTASGNISASYFLGNGSQLTGIDATAIQNGTANVRTFLNGNVTISAAGTANVLVVTSTGANIAGTLNATGNANVGNIGAATGVFTNISGTLTTAAQTNITSVGTLGSLTVTGNVSTGNVSGTLLTGTLATAAQPNVTSVGTLTSLTVTGNITGGNLLTGGNIVDTGALSIITGASGNIALAPNGSNVLIATTTGANVTGTLNATGNITGGNLTVSTGTINVGNIVNTNSNGVGNIGSSSLYFNTVFAKATSAQYADLAEMYEADQFIDPGTVVCFGGSKEIAVCREDANRRIAGVVSTNPSYIMNAGLQGDYVVPVALTGRVPVRVTGVIAKGDMMVATADGRARAEANPAIGSVIGKALADFNGVDGIIEVVVGRL